MTYHTAYLHHQKSYTLFGHKNSHDNAFKKLHICFNKPMNQKRKRVSLSIHSTNELEYCAVDCNRKNKSCVRVDYAKFILPIKKLMNSSLV